MGLLRQDEATQVLDTFSRNLGVRVVHVDAADEMYAALDGVADPEQKRRIIGRLFVDVFQRESARLAERGTAAKWLAQGTIYPDVIESAGAKTKKAHTIKSHHNVGGLPETLHLEAPRAAAGTVQGRGARAGVGARACRARWCFAIRSPARVWACASWAR